MHDSQVAALPHPATNEILMASILGRLRSVFALVIYRGNSGHRWLRNAILSEGESNADADASFEMDALKVEFVPKSELTKEDRPVLTAVGYSPLKGARSWPQFRSLVPGGYPWYVMQAEAETLQPAHASDSGGIGTGTKLHGRRHPAKLARWKPFGRSSTS